MLPLTAEYTQGVHKSLSQSSSNATDTGCLSLSNFLHKSLLQPTEESLLELCMLMYIGASGMRTCGLIVSQR